MDPISDTQREAWEAIQPKLPELRLRVFQLVKRDKGACLFEASEALKIPFHHLSGCFTHLRDQGLIRDSGERRVFEPTGRKHIVWLPTGLDTPQKRVKTPDRWKKEAMLARKIIDALPPIAFFEPKIQTLLKAHDDARNERYPLNHEIDFGVANPNTAGVLAAANDPRDLPDAVPL